MKKIPDLSKVCSEERGQGLTEYVIILALVAVTSIVAIKTFGGAVHILFARVTHALGGTTYDGPKFDSLKGDLDKVTTSKDLSNFDE